ncbi:CHAT domain-containing protein [Okeania sp. SIO3I5]|uniref:CHAT domain-containing protein n=1 Tax=Okeania sp. SIO3I5 TaxID=2607805 RepID=UPI0025D1DADE|nr:CHAT domain-containing protein [Okeania sp. SIO3I5]
MAQKPIQQIEQKGRELYQQGQFLEAINLWQEVAQDHAKQQQFISQAQTLNYISTAYQALGKWQAAKKAIASSLEILGKYNILDRQGTAVLAQALNTQGNLQLSIGHTQAALETWQQAEKAYTRAENLQGKLGSQINQAQALQTLGQYPRSKEILEAVNQQLQEMPNSQLKANGLRSLGVTLQLMGDIIKSKEILEQSWAVAEQLDSPGITSAALFSIGNLARNLQLPDVALQYYQEAANLAVNTENSYVQLQALLNEFRLVVEEKQWEMAVNILPKIISLLETTPSSRDTIYAKINLAETLMQIDPDATIEIASTDEIATLLATTVVEAKKLPDLRATAYALNQLGHLYEQNQQWPESEKLTQEALKISQNIDTQDLIVSTSWQLGRIFQQEGKTQEAIQAYENAYNALQLLRSDIVAVNQEIQLDFRESIEPVYREYIGLLLQNAPTITIENEAENRELKVGSRAEKPIYQVSPITCKEVGCNVPTLASKVDKNTSQENISKALKAIEALQLAELDNFFQEACLETKPVQLDQIDSQSAVIYPIILSDRLEVILSLPDRPLSHYSTPLPQAEIRSNLEQLYSAFYVGFSQTERLKLAEEVYNWLIQPAEADLAANNIQTLVFVLDGFLRNIPMASLYDGEQYLIEKYGIALSQGLQLFPEGLQRGKLEVLMSGLTEARQGFTPLPGVGIEIEEIAKKVDSKTILLNEEFTEVAFQEKIEKNPFRVVHLATHGQFSSDPEETFLLTWDTRIQVKEFAELLQEQNRDSIELLILSACQTAAGDDRAGLGLAGLALRSGARSTLATLWSVDDLSTAEFMINFYRVLTTKSETNFTKAEAIRQAQIALIKNPQYSHPYFWAPFVLVGNWL